MLIKTVEELVNDLDFQEFVIDEFSKFVKERRNRSNPIYRSSYRRDWFDRMSDAGCLSSDYFIQNIGLIWEKKSKLNREFRDIINYVCSLAFERFIELNDKQQHG